MGTNTRFRWIITPGTDIFFVYNHNWLDNHEVNRRLITTQKGAAMKVVYTVRF
ncbi:hypothetical protein [Arenibacter amylolyticus]|uniref:hypothetical protein n=1 Tax=Arenibacter amylolyticus TaxID=1406873 RepID=UPI001592CB9D|nr:hypothetical protein [Arenibacter amylolyticus]